MASLGLGDVLRAKAREVSAEMGKVPGVRDLKVEAQVLVPQDRVARMPAIPERHLLPGRRRDETAPLAGEPACRWPSEAERLGHLGDPLGADLEAELVKEGVARVPDRLEERERAAVVILPVVVQAVPEPPRLRAREAVERGEDLSLERRGRDDDLEERARRVEPLDGPIEERPRGVLDQSEPGLAIERA